MTKDTFVELTDSNTPEFFIEGFQGITVRNGVVKLNLFSSKFDFITETEKKCGVATLAIPLPDFVAIAEVLSKTISDLEEKGLITKIAVDKKGKEA